MNENQEKLFYRLIGRKVRKAREQAGVSQAHLAKQLAISRASVVNIEAGRQRAPLHLLWSMAEKLHTEATLLIPSSAEYTEFSDPIKLDEDTIHKIESAANGNLETRQALEDFIQRAKTQ